RTVIQLLSLLVELKLINDIKKEILVINDYSSDQTEALVTDFIKKHPSVDIKLHSQNMNMGKGAALHMGISLASGDYLIPQDADLELNPEDINKLLLMALTDNLDVVYGTRFNKTNKIDKTPAYYANIFLTIPSNLFTGLKLTDMETCYK